MKPQDEQRFENNLGTTPASNLELLEDHLRDLGDDDTPLNKEITIGDAIKVLENLREEQREKEELEEENTELRVEIRGLQHLYGN